LGRNSPTVGTGTLLVSSGYFRKSPASTPRKPGFSPFSARTRLAGWSDHVALLGGRATREMHNEGHEEKHEEHKEDNLRNPRCGTCNTSEAEGSCD